MCLGIPMKVVEVKGETGIVEDRGVKREVGLIFVEDVKRGDWLIVHAGFAISKVSQKDAEETLSLLKETGYID